MTDDADAPSAVAGSARPPSKRPWHPPSLEEVDHSATEAADAGGGFDGGIYS